MPKYQVQRPQNPSPTEPSAPMTVADATSPTQAQSEVSKVTTDVLAPEIPRAVYDEAHSENQHRDFGERLAAARRPVVKTYTPPPVPPQIAENTRLEMEAGRKRVAESEAVEADRAKLVAAQNHKKYLEPWENRSVSVFRPEDFIEYKGTLKSPVQTQSKDSGLRR